VIMKWRQESAGNPTRVIWAVVMMVMWAESTVRSRGISRGT
jgi:hypothetical protein